MGKVYIYNGRKYSTNAYIDDDNNDYDGDLYDLLSELSRDKNTQLEEHTYTYYTLGGDLAASENDLDAEELIEEMFNDGYLDEVDFKKVEENAK